MDEKRFLKAVSIENVAISVTIIAALWFTSDMAIAIYVAVNLFAIVVSCSIIDSVSGELYSTAWWFHACGCIMILIALSVENAVDARIELIIAVPIFLSILLYICAKRKEKE